MALMLEERYDDLAGLRDKAKAEVAKVVVGQERTVELLLVAALAHGHVLLEGPPGSAKTLLGRAVAHMFGATFKRIQFTPDTTPAELNGVNVVKAGEHVFLPGAVFTNVLLADEINRTPPRTQAALFEPMQERQVTIDGKVHRLPDPFLVIATQNPYEHSGVFELPESQLDRFLFKINLEYADPDSELQMLNLPHNGIAPDMLGRGAAAARRRRPRQGAQGARDDRGLGRDRTLHRRARPAHAGHARGGARDQLARDDPPHECRRRRMPGSTAGMW